MKTENLTPAINNFEFVRSKTCRSLKVDRFKERQKLPSLAIELAVQNPSEAVPLPPPEPGLSNFYRL